MRSSIPKPKLLRVLAARPRLLISMGISGLVFLLLPEWLRLSARTIIAWDAGAICFLGLAWSMITSATPQKMRRRAELEDEGRWTILTLVVVAAFISLLAIGFVLKDQKRADCLYIDATRNAFGCHGYLFLVTYAYDVCCALRTRLLQR